MATLVIAAPTRMPQPASAMFWPLGRNPLWSLPPIAKPETIPITPSTAAD